MGVTIQMKLNEKLFLRDPQDSALGRKILRESILLFDEIGLEAFTFKKLAERIDSTEASIYRYFENKHLLLVYLVNMYWELLRIQLEFSAANIQDPRERLEAVVNTLAGVNRPAIQVEYADPRVLHRIVVAESTKAYHTKEVDRENQNGFFLSYKALARLIAGIILELKPGFPYPQALASNLLEMSTGHIYYARHLPSLTEVRIEGEDYEPMARMLRYFVFGLLG